MNLIDIFPDNIMSAIVRVDMVDCFILPRDDSNYLWRPNEEMLHHVRVVCTAIQYDKNDTFPLELVFNDAMTNDELDEISKYYEIGKLAKVKGGYTLHSPLTENLQVTIYDPIASYLASVEIGFFEESMGEKYLPQRTLESFYELQ